MSIIDNFMKGTFAIETIETISTISKTPTINFKFTFMCFQCDTLIRLAEIVKQINLGENAWLLFTFLIVVNILYSNYM